MNKTSTDQPPGLVAQSVASPTADPGVASLIPVLRLIKKFFCAIPLHTLIQEGCYQLQEKVCA